MKDGNLVCIALKIARISRGMFYVAPYVATRAGRCSRAFVWIQKCPSLGSCHLADLLREEYL